MKDKELKVLDQIARNSVISQRELSRATGISLGLINVILKKFLQTGYLQVKALNKRKLEYVLTAEGFLAVARKTVHFATRTIRNYRQLHDELTSLLTELHESGYSYFSIHGDGELREMIENLVPMIFAGNGAKLVRDHQVGPDAVVLSVSTEPLEKDFEGHVIDVLGRIEN